MNPLEFFDQKPVFTHEEFQRYAISKGATNKNTQREILAYHVKKKNIIRIRRGLFASIPLSSRNSAEVYLIDPYLIAGRINTEAILAYHSAFDLHGISHSLTNRITFLSNKKIRSFTFQQTEFICISFQKSLVQKNKKDFEVVNIDRQGLNINVTSLERTLVDTLDRPEYAGGWEEIWKATEYISILNFNKMSEYALLLDNATTIAKLGFFLEQHKDQFNVNESTLIALEKKKPTRVHYFERSKRESGKFIKRWNLIVPNRIIEKTWEEPVNDDI